jgi:hypothetical protein
MKRPIISGSLILILSMACEEKKKTVWKPVQPSPGPSETISSPDIHLPAVPSPVQDDPPIEAPKDKISLESPEPAASPGEPGPVSLAAKTLPVPIVKYEDVSTRDLAEGSANELKNESLARIREKAMQRAKEWTDDKATNKDSSSSEGTTIAKVEPNESLSEEQDAEASPPSPAAELPLDEPVSINRNIDRKSRRDLDLRFAAAVVKAKAGRLVDAKNDFLSICQSGHAHACHKFAWYEEQGGNRPNALRFYRAACDNGLGKSCNNLAFQFEKEKNFEKALELYAMGCMDKHEASCNSLKRIREEQSSEGLRTR